MKADLQSRRERRRQAARLGLKPKFGGRMPRVFGVWRDGPIYESWCAMVFTFGLIWNALQRRAAISALRAAKRRLPWWEAWIDRDIDKIIATLEGETKAFAMLSRGINRRVEQRHES